LIAGAGEIQVFLLKFQVLPGNLQPPTTATQFDIIPRHLGQHAEHHIVASLHRCLPLRIRSFERAALAAEQINFPGRVETDVVNAVFEGKVRGQRQ
jgi:hypothetical protein